MCDGVCEDVCDGVDGGGLPWFDLNAPGIRAMFVPGDGRVKETKRLDGFGDG